MRNHAPGDRGARPLPGDDPGRPGPGSPPWPGSPARCSTRATSHASFAATGPISSPAANGRSIGAEVPLEPVEAAYRGEVAERYRYLDGAGEIGVIASVTQPFCGDCTRARISADGKLYTCLFAVRGHDLRGVLRGGVDDDELAEAIRGIWRRRTDRYSERRTEETSALRKVEMSYIGG